MAKDIIPNKSVIIRPNDKPWYSEDLRRQRRAKDRLYQSAKTGNTQNSWTEFNQARNAYCQAIKRAKEEYDNSKYLEIVDEGKWIRKKWSHISKSLLGQTGDTAIPPLHYERKIITEDKDKASAFNSFFSGVAQLDDSNANIPDTR